MICVFDKVHSGDNEEYTSKWKKLELQRPVESISVVHVYKQGPLLGKKKVKKETNISSVLIGLLILYFYFL